MAKSVPDFNNKHLLVFLAPNIIFISQLEKDIGRRNPLAKADLPL